MMEDKEQATFGLSMMGGVFAAVISYTANHSFWWMFFHTLWGWLYVIYWGIKYSGG
jgi:hypothetical protein